MKRHLFAALEALSSAVPSTLAAIVWLGLKIGPSMIPAMILAAVCGIAITNFFGSFSRRPLVYVARFFEISLLVGFIDSLLPKLAVWGLVDSPALRLTWVMSICVFAAILQMLFYSMKLQRLMRYIPAPVFTGFLNAVALILVISQTRAILLLVQNNKALLAPSLAVAGMCLAIAVLVRRFKPHLPAGMMALAAASAAAFILSFVSIDLPYVLSGKPTWVLPVALLDKSLLGLPPQFLFDIFLDLFISGLLLALVVFLNTVLASEVMTQTDDKPEPSLSDSMFLAAGQVMSACLGSAPISGAPAASMAAMRDGEVLEPAAIRWFCLLIVVFYCLNFVTWLPNAAIIGLLLFEAICLFDRQSAVALWRYLGSGKARRAMTVFQRDDLFCMAVVTFTGVLFNMVAALVAGVILGLVQFAKRNGKTAIRDIRSASRIRSNVARSALEMQYLVSQGDRIKCVSLQGALYFGIARSLRADLFNLLPNTSWLVLDWKFVTSQDGTLNHMLGQFEKKAQSMGVAVLHASRTGSETSFPDLDRALEHCESQLLAMFTEQAIQSDAASSATKPPEGIFHSGFDQAALLILRQWFQIKHYEPGEVLLAVGELKREMHLIIEGGVDVMISDRKIRVASVRAGAILGEANFLVGVRRAADAIALDHVTTHMLSYERFQMLSKEHPEVSQRLMLNLCTELVNRSRSLQMQIERERQ